MGLMTLLAAAYIIVLLPSTLLFLKIASTWIGIKVTIVSNVIAMTVLIIRFVLRYSNSFMPLVDVSIVNLLEDSKFDC